VGETRIDPDIPHPPLGAEPALRRLAELARVSGSEAVCEEAEEIAERMAQGRIYVACVGQFKRGKSTLLGALVGDRILPTGVVPVTTVPTIVRYGPSKAARVRFQGRSWTAINPENIAQFVSEEQNPENTKGVAGVEVFFASPLLATGISFVDTPGLGSIFAANTEATRTAIPHIDAALVVLGADPPIAGEELMLVEQLGKQVRDLLVVLNKADKATDSEREIAKSFTQRVLEKRLHRPIGPIYEISAEERLQNRGPARDWEKLILSLKMLGGDSRPTLVRDAGERGLRRLSEKLLAIASEERNALLHPIEESERRIQSLRHTALAAERSLRDIGYLLMAEQRRLSDMLQDQRKKFLVEAAPKASSEFAEALKRIPRRYGPRFRRDAMSAAQQITRRHVLPWLEAEQLRADKEYRRVEARFLDIGNDFLVKLSQSGVPELVRVPNALDSEKGFRAGSHFAFEQLIHVAEPASPLRYVADIFLGAIQLFSRIERDAWEFLDHLMDANSARVQSDIVDRLQHSRDQLETEIRKLLHEVSHVAERALEHGRAARAEGASAVEAALVRLNNIEREVLSLCPSQENLR
jgi:hypothetical protein